MRLDHGQESTGLGWGGEATRASLHLWEHPIHRIGPALGDRSGGTGGQARLWTLQVQTPRDDHKHGHLVVTWLVGGHLVYRTDRRPTQASRKGPAPLASWGQTSGEHAEGLVAVCFAAAMRQAVETLGNRSLWRGTYFHYVQDQ